MDTNKIIGVVGGMGPAAGLDLMRKIIDQTIASTDQDHLDVILSSLPGQIEDRTNFILGESDTNPAFRVIEILNKLIDSGANVLGIPCNTIHAPQIFNIIDENIKNLHPGIVIINMIEEVIKLILEFYSEKQKIGIISTLGAYQANIYQDYLKKSGLIPIIPDDKFIQEIHLAIYHPAYGIKANSGFTPYSKVILEKTFDHLLDNNAQIIILGCTEIAMYYSQSSNNSYNLVDSNLILARALIRECNPEKLKKYR